MFNLCACFMYLSTSLFMAFTVSFWLYPRFELQRGYTAYPAMTAVYVSIFIEKYHFKKQKTAQNLIKLTKYVFLLFIST